MQVCSIVEITLSVKKVCENSFAFAHNVILLVTKISIQQKRH